ncbi:MAG: low specificity L-threonine aldolase [Lachnospiraceae bacterium]|nr:low specificity L-threonine aldolase [Lachnospiraceae bacterium]
MEKLSFASDYMEGAHPEILKRLIDTNMIRSAGYGFDEFSESARNRIRKACNAKDADVYFLVGGTQTNAVMIDVLLQPYQGVIAAKSGHITSHEAGAVEHTGHKVLELDHIDGKITDSMIDSLITKYRQDENHEHMVMPGMVYISQPTEYGTLYSRKELEAISSTCRKHGVFLYMDGARLAYALSCPENDVTLRDIAALCDVFYIGGTKCGALFGEAVVIPEHDRIPYLFTMIKQHGALLAKGRIAGVQFDTLFTDGLYDRIGQTAVYAADRIRKALRDKGYTLAVDSPTNQIFVILDNEKAESLADKVELAFWERTDDSHVIMRIATSWATSPEDVDRLIDCL